MKKRALEQRTYRELRLIAARTGLASRGRMSKAQLVRAILKGPKPTRSRMGATKGRKTAAPSSRSARAVSPRAARRGIVRKRHAPAAAALRAAQRKPSPVPPEELPDAYGRTRVTLMEVDPGVVHAYWEVTAEDREAAVRRMGSGNSLVAWVLRFYEIGDDGAGQVDGCRHFDVSVDLRTGNWYVQLPAAGRSLCAEIGPVDAGGRFTSACRSNIVHTPRREASLRYAPRWLEVSGARSAGAPEPPPEAAPSPGPPPASQTGHGRPGPGRGRTPAGHHSPGADEPFEYAPETDAAAGPVLTPEASSGAGLDRPYPSPWAREDASSFELGARGAENADSAEGDGPQRSK